VNPDLCVSRVDLPARAGQKKNPLPVTDGVRQRVPEGFWL
jgi:hypothetical protein